MRMKRKLYVAYPIDHPRHMIRHIQLSLSISHSLSPYVTRWTIYAMTMVNFGQHHLCVQPVCVCVCARTSPRVGVYS